MNYGVMSIAVLLIGILLTSFSAAVCPVGWVVSSDGLLCYLIMTDGKPHTEARHICRSKEAHLVEITSEVQKDDLCGKISDDKKYWMGIQSNGAVPATFEYDSNGREILYSNWETSEPDNDKCVYLDDGNNCEWFTATCSTSYEYVCERPSTTEDMCPTDWLAYDTTCIQFENSVKVDFFNAKDVECPERGGSLVSLTDWDKHLFIFYMIQYMGDDHFWIGYNIITETWWSDESMKTNYSIPWKNTPVDGECVLLAKSGSFGEWESKDCSSAERYICEIPKDLCSSSPCQNGDQCENTYSGYLCNCTSEYSGQNCDTLLLTTQMPTTENKQSLTTVLATTPQSPSQESTLNIESTLPNDGTTETSTKETIEISDIKTETLRDGTTDTSTYYQHTACDTLNDYDDFIYCFNETLLLLYDEYIQSIKESTTSLDTISVLKDNMIDMIQYPRDILICKDLLVSLLANNPLRDSDLTVSERSEFIKNSLTILDNLLNVNLRSQWKNLDEFVDDNTAAQLLDDMDDFGNHVIDFMNVNSIQSIHHNKGNILAEYIVRDITVLSDILFPDKESDTHIAIPSALFSDYKGTESTIGIANVLYRNPNNAITKMEGHRQIGSNIISSNLKPAPPLPFSNYIFITFHHNMMGNDTLCTFLDELSNSHSVWSTEGCELVESTQTETVCKCNHLTSFAVLMQPTSYQISEEHKQALSLLTFVGCGISLAALLVTFITLIYFRLNSDRITILQNMVLALMLAQFTFIIGINATTNKILCRCIAVLLHYLYLATFFWMMVQGIQLYLKTRNLFHYSTKVLHFILIGWGIPVVIVAISAGLKWQYYGNEQYCWLSLVDGLPAAFIAPAMIVIVMNCIVLCMVIRTFMSIRINAKKTDIQRIKAGIRAGVILVPLLGLTWVFGILAVNEDTLLFQYLFTLVNSLQGFFVFIFHCCLNDEVKSAFNKRFRRHYGTESKTCSTGSGNGNTSSQQTLTEAWTDINMTSQKSSPINMIKKSKANSVDCIR
ncbi:adhesion G protein-coupled receptor L4-like [Saccoglossus kowalevskii]